MQAPNVTVLDLTSRMGAYALAQLGVSGAEGHGAWENIPLGSVFGAPHLSWYRPFKVADLASLSSNPDAVAILVGPGSLSMLPAALRHKTLRTASVVWLLLLPNALMEDIEISKFLSATSCTDWHKYQLPTSDPQTLWFVLMEQLGKLQKFNKYFNEDRSESEMSTNLKGSMDAAMTIDGALAAALVDYRSGMCLAQAGGGMNLDLAAAGNTQVVRAKLKTMESLGIRRGIEDILITLADQYHLVRLVPNAEGLFLYLVLDRNKGNLALARYKLTDIERSLKV